MSFPDTPAASGSAASGSATATGTAPGDGPTGAPSGGAEELVAMWSRPEDQREDTHLVVMLHGFNSSEQDLMALVPHLPAEGFTYAALRAPVPAPGERAFRWFGLDQHLDFDPAELEAAVRTVVAWIQERAGQHSGVSLLGFSQGMAVAVSVARHVPELASCVVGLSGFVPQATGTSDFFDDAALAARSPRLPMFYGRDQADPVISAEMVAGTLEWARGHAELTKVLYAGMGHGVCQQEIGHVGEFLRHVLGR